jgi:hypothetical protein
VNRTGSPSAIAPMIRIVHRSPMRSSTPRLRHNHHQPTRSLLQVLVGHSYVSPAILATGSRLVAAAPISDYAHR